MFMIAGFIEGYITRLYDVNIFLSLTVILLSLMFIVWYYILYPIQKYKPKETMFNSILLHNENE